MKGNQEKGKAHNDIFQDVPCRGVFGYGTAGWASLTSHLEALGARRMPACDVGDKLMAGVMDATVPRDPWSSQWLPLVGEVPSCSE